MENAVKQPLIVPDERESRSSPHALPMPSDLMQALALGAANPNVDAAKLRELWAIKKEIEDRASAQLFAEAMARAQAKIVPIVRDRRNDHTKSMYATLAAITDEVTPIMAAEGLAISFDTFNPERDKDLPPLEKGWVRVIALVSHCGGHVRKYHLDGPLDDAGKDGTKNKTGIQAMGSTVQYLRRYLVCMIGNVATYDGEDDGNAGSNGGGGAKLTDREYADFLATIDSAADRAGVLAAFAKAYNRAESVGDKGAAKNFLRHRDEVLKKFPERARR